MQMVEIATTGHLPQIILRWSLIYHPFVQNAGVVPHNCRLSWLFI